jgi:hypothetical protein
MKIYFFDTLKLNIVEARNITFTPKSVVVRGIAESMADFAAGHAFGPIQDVR